jgi:hypothetical protein
MSLPKQLFHEARIFCDELIRAGYAPALKTVDYYKRIKETDRLKIEKDLEDELAKLNEKQRKQLLKYLGDPPDIDNIPVSFWNDGASAIRKTLQPALAKMAFEQAMTRVDEFGVEVSWQLVNQNAVRWAEKYSFDKVKEITETKQKILNEAVADFFAKGQTRAELEAHLIDEFGPNSASRIAVTETTRAASEGDDEILQELADAGIVMDEYWETDNDKLVCEEICAPRNGKIRGDGWDEPPPAHVNCRCRRRLAIPGAE